jgi:hypothetical protein
MDLFSSVFDELFSSSYEKTEKNHKRLMSKENKEKISPDTIKKLVIKQPDPIALEKNLIGAERNLELIGFFSPASSAKGRPQKTKTLEKDSKENGKRVKRKVSIRPNVDYGRPITTDLDLYRAFFRLLKEIYYDRGIVENPVEFKDEQLIKAMGKARHGRLTKDIRDWMSRMKGTLIESENWIYEKKNKRYLKASVSVFDKIYVYGEEIGDRQKADRNYVWLSDWFLGNLNTGLIFLIDHEVYKNLKYPIAKCLYGLLWWGFYAVKSKNREFYWKDYRELCNFLDMTEYRYESKIREKLKPAHEELLRNKVILKWKIEKNVSGEGFNIKWWPGDAFESYYSHFKRELQESRGQLTFDGMYEEIPGNHKIENHQDIEKFVKYFHKEITKKDDCIPRKKELEKAEELIKKYGEEKTWFIVKYAVAKMQETNFKPEHFGAIKNYVSDSLNKFESEQKLKRKKEEKNKEDFEQKIEEYKRWFENTPEQRVQHMVDFWMNKVKTFEKRDPTEEEILKRQQELILQELTPEAKQKRLFGKVIFKENTLELIK